ncbi:MAG: hypothetical protein KDN22_08260 [Verrucomicrobiae bacterium]|nr:hypothetical protein [Verrucomicrobiae bacterium]
MSVITDRRQLPPPTQRTPGPVTLSDLHRFNPEREPVFIPVGDQRAALDAHFNHTFDETWRSNDDQPWLGKFGRFLAIFAAITTGWVIFFSKANVSSVDCSPTSDQLAFQALVSDVGLAQEALQQFFAATTVSARSQYVRKPEKTVVRMERYYQKHPLRADLIEFGEGIDEAQTKDGIDLLWFDFKGSDRVWRTAVFERTGDGLKLDWDSLAGYEEVSWNDFGADPSNCHWEAQTFRLRVSLDDYYNHAFSDSSQYACFRVENQDQTATRWAYARWDSSVCSTMLQLLERSETSLPLNLAENTVAMATNAVSPAVSYSDEVRVTLALRMTEPEINGEVLQLQIDEVVSESWFVR